jgi:hypothetical protein
MIRPWVHLNTRGRVLAIACVTNIWCAVYLAYEGEWMCLFSAFMAAFCGIMTYSRKYQHQDAKDINEGREE